MSSKIKILHIISSLGRGGRERQLSVMVHYPIPEFEQFIVTFYDIKNSYAEEYNLTNLIFLPKNKIKRFIELFKIAKKNKINIIYAWGNGEALYGIPIAWLLNIKFVNGSIRHGITLNKFSHRFRSIVLRRNKYIIGNSEAGFKANKINVDSKKHFVLYNGIEDKFFININNSNRNTFLLNKKLNDDMVILISVANFIPYKDYFTTLQCLRKLKDDGIKFHYIAIGKGKMEEEIKLKIKELILEEYISIYSNNPNIAELLSVADIMIHSSLGEGCSNAILEAKAAGVLVVASNTGGTKEIVGKEDYLFEYKDVIDLEMKLKEAIKVVKEKSVNKTLIQNQTRDLFSVKKMQENYNRIIRTILDLN